MTNATDQGFSPWKLVIGISPHTTSRCLLHAWPGPPCAHTCLLELSRQMVRAPPAALCPWLWGTSPAGVWCAGPVLPYPFFLLRLKGPCWSEATLASPGSWVWPEAVAATNTCWLSPGQDRPQLAHLCICSASHRWESEVLRAGAYQSLAISTWQARIPAHSAGLKVSVSQHTALGLWPPERH